MSNESEHRDLIGDTGRALLVIALMVYPLLAGKNFRWQNLAMHVVVAAAALLWYVGEMRNGRQVVLVRHKLLDRALLVFFGIVTIAIIPSVYKYASLLFVVWLLDCLLVYWMAREAFSDEKWRLAVPVALVAAGAICALLGLREYVRTVFFTGGVTWRIFGPLYNPNILASYLIGPLLIALGLISSRQRPIDAEKEIAERPEPGDEPRPRYGMIALGFAILLIGPAILLTGSRAGFIALVIGLGVFAFARAGRGHGRKRTALVSAGILVVILAAFFAVPPLRNRMQRTFSLDSHSVAFRYYTWLGTTDMVRAKPLLGSGPGTFEYSYPAYARAGFTRMAHQSFLQIAAEAGIAALIAALVAGIAAVWLCVKLAQGRADRTGAIAAAAAGWLVALAVHNLADYSLYVPAVAVSALALLGTALRPTGVPVAPAVAVSGKRWALAIGLLTVFGLGCWLLTGEALTARSEKLLNEGRYHAAEGSALTAVRLLDFSAESWDALAEVYETQVRGPDSIFLQKAIYARMQMFLWAPTAAKPCIALARLFQFKQLPLKALDWAQRAVEIYPTNVRGLVELAQLQEHAGHADEAKATYQRAVALLDGPVGKYPAVPELPDLSYVWAWAYLAKAAYAAGDETAGTQMLYDALLLINTRLRGEELRFELEQKTTGRRPADLVEIETMVDHVADIVWEHPSPTNKLRLAEARRRLGQWIKQETLLLEVIVRPEAGGEGEELLLRGIAYLELGRLYGQRDRDDEAKEAYSEGLRLVEQASVDAVEKGGQAAGRWPVDAERLHKLIESAETAGN